MSDPLTDVAVDGAPNLAIDVQPDDIGGSFVLDVSMIDDVDLLGWADPAADGEWLNVVCDVTRVSVRRGATRLQGPLTRTEAGEATIVVRDADRRFDPMVNADAIHAGTPLRVRAWGGLDPAAPDWSAVLFTAQLDEVPVSYTSADPPTVTLLAVDVIAELAGWSSAGRADPGVGAGDDLLARVGRVLDETGVPATVSPDSDADYVATLNPSNLARGWDDVVVAADAELGRIWVDAYNRLVVRARESQLSGPIRGTLSDWHDETVEGPHCCYADPFAAVLGTELLRNRAIAERRVPTTDPASPASTTVQLDEETSQSQYRRVRVEEQRALELQTNAQLTPWAESVLIGSSRQELRIDAVTPAPWGADDAAWQAVCETDLGDRWSLRYHPALGPTVMRTIGVLGIELEVTPEGWSVVWTTVEAPTPGTNPTGWFALDVSELDEGDLLAPFGGVVPALPA